MTEPSMMTSWVLEDRKSPIQLRMFPIVLQLEKLPLVGDGVEGFGEIKQYDVNVLFVVQSYGQVVNGENELSLA